MNGNERQPDKDDMPPSETVLPLVEEVVRIDKRTVATGGVRIETVTDTIETRVQREVSGERVEVERVPVGTPIEIGAEPPRPRTEGNVTIVPVLEEIVVVEKRLRLTEELHVTRHTVTETVETPVALRKQRAIVHRLNSKGEIVSLLTEKNHD